MPTVPSQKVCNVLGCKNPKGKYSGSCIEHGGSNSQKIYRTADRDRTHAFYGTAQWMRKRAQQLSAEPLCQSCLQRNFVTAATEVDHIFPWRQIGDHAFYRNAFQSLCHDCHSYKTQQEKHGKIVSYTDEQTKTYSITDYAFVVDN